jgi:hypothetical protein
MSPSSDIETLFGHFGGNAGAYQEIGRENEAGTARTRWPLLVTLDLKQTPIPAIAQHREPLAQQADNAEAQSGEPNTAADPSSAADATSGMQALRNKAPLFARPHRRNVPPVANVIKADAPRGGDRFGAVPEVSATLGEAVAPAEPVAPISPIAPVTPVASIASVAPVAPLAQGMGMQPVTQPAPVAQPLPTAAAAMQSAMPVAAASALPPGFSRPAAIAPAATRTFASTPVPPAPSRPVMATVAPGAPVWAKPPAAIAQPAARPATPAAAPAMPVARTSAAAQPPTILGRLFAAAAPQSAPAMQTRAGEARPPELTSVFDRLRGASSNTAAPVSAPHSWLNNGPRRS